MEAHKVFVDTWGWLALGHRSDPDHDRVKEIFQELRHTGMPMWTSDYVLDELITLLFRREVFGEAQRFLDRILRASVSGKLRVERVTNERFARAFELRKRYSDKPAICFTDLTSMAIMQERGISRIISGDDHFTHVGLGFRLLPTP